MVEKVESVVGAELAMAAARATTVSARAPEAPKQTAALEIDEAVTEVSREAARDVKHSLSMDGMKEVLKFANQALESANNSLRFQLKESLVDNPVITVVDQDSGQVIRQLPSEEIVHIANRIDEMRGILFDSRRS